jgi:hypothetical protein
VGEGGRKYVIVGQLPVSEAYGAAPWPAEVWALVAIRALYGADGRYGLQSTTGLRPDVCCRREPAAIGGSQSLDPPPGPLLGARNSTIVRLMSALPPKAAVERTLMDVAKVPEPDGGSPLYTRALSRWAAIGKASSVSFVYFPKPFLVSVTRAARAASLACDTGPANGEPAT